MRKVSEINKKLNAVLKYMTDDPVPKTCKDISDNLYISKSSTSNYIKSLIEANCIRLVIDKNKQTRGQTFRYTLTASGHRMSFTGDRVEMPQNLDMAESHMCKLSMIFINQTVNRSGNFI